MKNKFFIIIVMFLTFGANFDSARAQQGTYPYQNFPSDDFGIGFDFSKRFIDLGYTYHFDSNILQEAPPYKLLSGGRVWNNALPNQSYPVRIVVYVPHTDYTRSLLNKTNIKNGTKAGIPYEEHPNDPSYNWNWRDDYIKIAESDNHSIQKIIHTEFGEVINLPALPILNIGGENVIIDTYLVAVGEVGIKVGNDTVFIPVEAQGLSVGDYLTPFTLTICFGSKYNGKPNGIQMEYNVLTAFNTYAYGVLLKTDWCLIDYTVAAFNDVYDAIQNGGYDAGFEKFKDNIKAVCNDDIVGIDHNIIGFVKLNKKTPQGQWVSFPACVTEGCLETPAMATPNIVTLGRESDGHPFAVDSTTTIASGGMFRFEQLKISIEPNSPKCLSSGMIPGEFYSGPIYIPPCDDPNCDPGPLPQETATPTVNLENIFTVHNYAVVVQGNGTVFVYNSLGLLVQQISVNGEITIGTSHLPLELYLFKYISKDNKITHSKKIVVGRY